MLTAVLTIESQDAGTVSTSLRPEAGRELPRTHVTIEDGDGSVTIRIEAADTSAMRAALNSYLGCIKITEDIDRITR
ncbi:MAG: hypothetical protein J6Y18_00235 [Candidatus Methanomethylophilaceae archaeon]|nr:hypothetical protein [Candidatus Methanomethylophilaceae archaeon]